MTTESDIRKYLADRVTKLGGEIRALKWIGRRHAPDVFIMLPDRPSFFVETKAPGKRPRPGQVREHERMRKFGVVVLVLAAKEDIDRELPL